MAELPSHKSPVPDPEPHKHEFRSEDPQGNFHCHCGARLVLQEPAPEVVNCYRGVIGHWGYDKAMGALGHCRNKILKSQEPPYCGECQMQMKFHKALDDLVGKTIASITISGSDVRVSYRDGSSSDCKNVSFLATVRERWGEHDIEWEVC